MTDSNKHDNLTGLPAVSENQFWRVEALKYDRFGIVLDEQRVFVKLMKKETREWEDVVPFTFFQEFLNGMIFGHLPRKYKTDTHTFNSVVRIEDARYADGSNILPDNLTAKDIYRTAENILMNLAKEKAADALLGDYPPKKLEIES